MTSRDFAFWLQGYFEVSDPKEIGQRETKMIKRHLALVFKHEIDPSMGDETHQSELNSIHSVGIGNSGTCGTSTTNVSPTFPDEEPVYRC